MRRSTTNAVEESVVLVSEQGRILGTEAKSLVHGRSTKLHLAFSCYLIDDLGRVLVTRRALSKQTWPGVWSNSFCGHPGPGEQCHEALTRRARQELGVEVGDIRNPLPHFRYRAVDANGIVENELCPVFTARVRGELHPDPDEVMEWEWVSLQPLSASLNGTPFIFSPWMRLQFPELLERGVFGAQACG